MKGSQFNKMQLNKFESSIYFWGTRDILKLLLGNRGTFALYSGTKEHRLSRFLKKNVLLYGRKCPKMPKMPLISLFSPRAREKSPGRNSVFHKRTGDELLSDSIDSSK